MATVRKPQGGEKQENYSFRNMALDGIEVMAHLGYKKFMVAGHDRGGRVVHRMCLDHPDKVERAAILDIIPQHHLLNNVTRQWGTFSWHWFFIIQPYDFPERLMGADPDYFIQRKLAKTAQGLSFFDTAALAEYKRCFRNPATIHAMCEDYRATFGVDLDMDSEDFAAGRKITMPLLLLWGATGGVGRNQKPAWRFGRAMPPTSGRARLCPADTIFPKKRRMKPTASFASSLSRTAGKCRGGAERILPALPTTKTATPLVHSSLYSGPARDRASASSSAIIFHTPASRSSRLATASSRSSR